MIIKFDIINLFKKLKKFRTINNKKLYVFCFHSVSDNPSDFCSENNLNIKCIDFKKIIEHISKNFTVISPDNEVSNNNVSSANKPKALITFDDGFDDSFDNGISYLIDKKIPVLIFLNMRNIIYNNIPLIPAVSQYLNKINYFDHNNIVNSHLKYNPDIFNISALPKNLLDSILVFQGKLINKYKLENFLDSGYVFVGNHLFEHWNTRALSNKQIIEIYKKNHDILLNYRNYLGDFAFTNGVVRSCWSYDQLQLIKCLGAKRIFAANGGLYNDGILIDRISLSQKDVDIDSLYFKLYKSRFRDIYLSCYLNLAKIFKKF